MANFSVWLGRCDNRLPFGQPTSLLAISSQLSRSLLFRPWGAKPEIVSIWAKIVAGGESLEYSGALIGNETAHDFLAFRDALTIPCEVVSSKSTAAIISDTGYTKKHILK